MAIQEQFTFQSAATTNGNGTAGDVSGLPGVLMQVEGITTASVLFEGSIDESTYYGIQAVNITNGSVATLTTADGLWYVPAGGLEKVRAKISTYSGGTITVSGRAIYNPMGMTVADIDIAGAEGVAVTLSEAQWDDTDKLAVSLYAKTTAGGDTPLEMGQDTIAASLSVAPATNIADATYIGDIKFGEALPAGTALLGKVGIDQTTPGTTNKVAIGPSLDGSGAPTIDSYASAVIDLAASTVDQQIIATPGANKQIWVYGFGLLCDTAAGTIVFQDEANTALTGTMAFSDEGGISVAPSGNFAMPIWKVPTNKALEADTGACTVDGWICYAVVSI